MSILIFKAKTDRKNGRSH